MVETTIKKSRFFRKIPKAKLIEPGGIVCFVLACLIELLDFLLDAIGFLVLRGPHSEVMMAPLKTFLDLLFAIFSAPLLGVSVLSNIVPFLIERVPILSTILPTWVLRIFL